ncbi:triose-phosphate isomerase, partial [Rickettsiales bacterium]|nr:triose-phosphate isomerase [Rickettsiales bacterium]
NINNKKYKIILAPPSIMIDHIDEILMNHELERLEKASKNIDDLEEDELENLMSKMRYISISGQDCHYQEKGAFTGDISSKMLSEAGCEYVIIGHSERRQYHYEKNNVILAKLRSALKEKLIPILCIGENLEIRENISHIEFIKNQLENNIPKNQEINNILIAYEPIWSIGTGKIPTNDEIAEIAQFIKNHIDINFKNIKNYQILYGGSVKAQNVQIANIKNIDGFLVGGASVDAEDFINILNKL